ncbi:MAG: DUF2063 domain-containing protein [Gammaproteobacteria bacterium]|nr:DUF2063 domain-containing protein [Gammaproteobacteria bacterium]
MASPTLENYQKLFSENLLSSKLSYNESENFLDHLQPMFGETGRKKEAEERFSIYRNNVTLSLSEAIADTFPVVKRLIGDDCFNAAAVAFIREHPPAKPSLLFYGKGFIDFIKTWPACSELGYLSDVAQLEWSYIRAFHAKDKDLLDNSILQQIAPESLGEVIFTIHPSVHLMRSTWPVDSIWEENLKDEVATLDLEILSPGNLLIYRQDRQVQVVNLSVECFNFLSALTEGKSITNAWLKTVELQQQDSRPVIDENELSGMLGYLLGLSLFTGVINPS